MHILKTAAYHMEVYPQRTANQHLLREVTKDTNDTLCYQIYCMHAKAIHINKAWGKLRHGLYENQTDKNYRYLQTLG